MTDVDATDFAVVVYREDDSWEAGVLPVALTEDLAGLIHALRQQPSIGGTIGMVSVGDDFFVALRLLGRWAWWNPQALDRVLPSISFGHGHG